MRRLIPRFKIRTLLVATALVAFTAPFIIAQLQRAWNIGGADVIVSGDTSPPDDDENCSPPMNLERHRRSRTSGSP